MAVNAPEPVSTNPLRRVVDDWRTERHASGPFPPGDVTFSLRRSLRLAKDPLGMLLEAYDRYGPVFTLRLGHQRWVFALGPEANHQMHVSNAGNFRYRDSRLADLIPLLGDGLFTTDGAFHRHSRRTMLPAFHHERILATHATTREEVELAVATWRAGGSVNVYTWARDLSLRIVLRELFGLDPTSAPVGLDIAHEFERALAFRPYSRQLLTPLAKLRVARGRLDAFVFEEVARRRARGCDGDDLLSLLLRTGQDATGFSDRQVRDHVVTMMVGGHVGTAEIIAMLLYELGRHPDWAERLADETCAIGEPSATQLTGTDLPQLELVIDETLRLYPPAWLTPRRCVDACDVAGVPVPAGALIYGSSWATHRLPDLWEQPHEFRPDRFAPGARDAIPRGAYAPFGGGSRTCIGMRFAQFVIRAVVARVVREYRLVPPPGSNLALRLTPVLGPKGDLPMLIADD